MKAGIVGVGKLGGTIAFALAREGPWDELVLVDAVPDLAWAQAEDIPTACARPPNRRSGWARFRTSRIAMSSSCRPDRGGSPR